MGFLGELLQWLEQPTSVRKVAPMGFATHDQILGVLRKESW